MKVHRLPSPSFDDRPAGTPVDMLVLHYTGMLSTASALHRLTDAGAEVSAHYLIDEDGRIWQLVEESKRAWHAGRSFWRGHTDVNARSIGIELVNPGHEFGYCPFPPEQMAATIYLCRELIRRHPIPARNVVGHSDVAPARKMDPGELFDWEGLAAAGIGLWPGEADVCPREPDEVQRMLASVGYDTSDMFLAIKAFQRHFRPSAVNGRIDFATARRLADLCARCQGQGPAAQPSTS